MKRTLQLILMVMAVVGTAQAQAVVDGFTLDQISFSAAHTGNVPCSEYGKAGFAVRQLPGQVQYVQVVAQLAGGSAAPAWIVQNVPAVGGITSQSTGVSLTPLGVARGMCVIGTKVNYTISITDNVIV